MPRRSGAPRSCPPELPRITLRKAVYVGCAWRAARCSTCDTALGVTGQPEARAQPRGDLDVRDADVFVETLISANGQGAKVRGSGPEHIGGLQRMPALHAPRQASRESSTEWPVRVTTVVRGRGQATAMPDSPSEYKRAPCDRLPNS